MSNTVHVFHSTALAAINQALVTLGQDVVLEAADLATDAKSAHGRKAAFLYDAARLRVLRDHAWNFARREWLVGGTMCSPCDEAFPFRIPLPPRCVKTLACYGHGRHIIHHKLFGGEIRSDEPIQRVVYTADEENLDKWTSDAYNALVLRLAADLAKPITGRINERQLQEQAYADMVATAKLHDASDVNLAYGEDDENRYVRAMRGGFRPHDDVLRR